MCHVAVFRARRGPWFNRSCFEHHTCGVRLVFNCSARLDADTRDHLCTKPLLAKTFQSHRTSRILSGLHSNSNFPSPSLWMHIHPFFFVWDESLRLGVFWCSEMYNRKFLCEFISQMWATFHSIIQCQQRQPDTRRVAAFSRWERTRNSISTATDMRRNPLY